LKKLAYLCGNSTWYASHKNSYQDVFFTQMPNKPALSISGQITLLKQRGMLFNDENTAHCFLENISYYRLKGYWWDCQADWINHTFKENVYFEDIIERYTFDRQLRLILFDAIERIEIALRTKMIHILSMSYGGLWYLNELLFEGKFYNDDLGNINREIKRSSEIFIKDHKKRFNGQSADAWKVLEIISLGTLSKIYKHLQHQLPEKLIIANSFGLNSHKELSNWLESLTYLRNVIAHHSRLWDRIIVKIPKAKLNNPKGKWLSSELDSTQINKCFVLISCVVYLCNFVTPVHHIKVKFLDLLAQHPNIPIYKYGFINDWKDEPLWK